MLGKQNGVRLIVLQIDGDHLPVAFVMIDPVGGQPPVVEGVKEVILQALPVVAFVILPFGHAPIINRLGILQDLLVQAKRLLRHRLALRSTACPSHDARGFGMM
jgi:hypothetical protein